MFHLLTLRLLNGLAIRKRRQFRVEASDWPAAGRGRRTPGGGGDLEVNTHGRG